MPKVHAKGHWLLIAVVLGCLLIISVVVFGGQSPQAPTQSPQVLVGHENVISSVAYSPDGKWIASSSMDHTVRLWDTTTGKPVALLRGHTDEVYAVVFAPNGRQLASTGYDRKLIVWDVPSGKLLRTVQGFPEWSIAIAYSPDGYQLALGGMDGTVTIYDPSTGSILRSFKPQRAVTALAFSPDGRLLASGMMPVVISEAATGRNLRTLQGAENIISSVSFSPDGRFIAAGSWDKSARIWNVETGSLVRTITPAMDLPPGVSAESLPSAQRAEAEESLTLPVTGVAFSPDGKLLVTGGADKTVRLWEVSTGKETDRFHGHSRAVTSVAFSPDGNRVVSGSADKTVLIFPVHPAPK